MNYIFLFIVIYCFIAGCICLKISKDKTKSKKDRKQASEYGVGLCLLGTAAIITALMTGGDTVVNTLLWLAGIGLAIGIIGMTLCIIVFVCASAGWMVKFFYNSSRLNKSSNIKSEKINN